MNFTPPDTRNTEGRCVSSRSRAAHAEAGPPRVRQAFGCGREQGRGCDPRLRRATHRVYNMGSSRSGRKYPRDGLRLSWRWSARGEHVCLDSAATRVQSCKVYGPRGIHFSALPLLFRNARKWQAARRLPHEAHRKVRRELPARWHALADQVAVRVVIARRVWWPHACTAVRVLRAEEGLAHAARSARASVKKQLCAKGIE